MKYTTFRNSLLAGVVLAAAGGSIYFVKHSSSPKVAPVVSTQGPTDSAAAKPTTGETTRPESPPPRGASTATDPPAARGLVAAPQAALADSGSKTPRVKTPLREMDRELMKVAAQPQKPGGDKVKDVFPSRPYKVNLFVEGTRVVRAKVDLNRNGKWDEKWSFEAGGSEPAIKRQVSPDDDDTNYTLNYKLAGDSWVQK